MDFDSFYPPDDQSHTVVSLRSGLAVNQGAESSEWIPRPIKKAFCRVSLFSSRKNMVAVRAYFRISGFMTAVPAPEPLESDYPTVPESRTEASRDG